MCQSSKGLVSIFGEQHDGKYCPRLHRGHVCCNWVRVCDDDRIDKMGERTVLRWKLESFKGEIGKSTRVQDKEAKG